MILFSVNNKNYIDQNTEKVKKECLFMDTEDNSQIFDNYALFNEQINQTWQEKKGRESEIGYLPMCARLIRQAVSFTSDGFTPSPGQYNII